MKRKHSRRKKKHLFRTIYNKLELLAKPWPPVFLLGAAEGGRPRKRKQAESQHNTEENKRAIPPSAEWLRCLRFSFLFSSFLWWAFSFRDICWGGLMAKESSSSPLKEDTAALHPAWENGEEPQGSPEFLQTGEVKGSGHEERGTSTGTTGTPTPATQGGSQARGRIGAAVAGLHHSHNSRAELSLWLTPQLTATTTRNP